jgi:HlyD family secretion protein
MKNKRRIIIPVAIIVVAVVLWLVVFRDSRDDGALLVSGTVEATEAQLGFSVPGRVEEISAREGDLVKTGAELARLDRSEAQARYDQARAQLEAARALLAELETGTRPEELAQARAARDAALERRDDASRDKERAQKLFDGGAISKEALDKAKTAFEVAENQYTQAEELVRQLETGPRKERIEAQRAAVAQSEASVKAAEAVLSFMVVAAPFDGLVSVRHREPGETVGAGAPILTLQNRDDRWVRVFVPEQRIGAVHHGSPAEITTDTYGDKTYSGVVAFIASEAEFTPKTVQTAEERVRLVYAVKVEITGDESYDLKPGMPADVRLEITE